MASFATDVKNELARLMYEKECCRRAELSALFRMRAKILVGSAGLGFSFTSENAAVARKAITLLKGIEKGIRTEVTATRDKRLNKRNSYIVRALPGTCAENLLNKLDLTMDGRLKAPERSIFRHSCCRAAYLRGAFLGGGSVNRPESSYHLELATESRELAEFLLGILRRKEFPAGLSERNDDYVVYIKEGESIIDFLGMLKAERAVDLMEAGRNLKEIRGQVNRIVNCETANLQKAATAAASQIADIRRLESMGRLPKLPEQLKETALARLENPEASLTELAGLLCISKSGLSHRMRKLRELAAE